MPLPRPVHTVAAAAAVIAALSACSPLPGAVTGHQHNQRAGTTGPAGRLAAARSLVRTGRGWSADGIQGPIPAPGTCHYRRTSAGEVLPHPRCTPGAVETAVTQGNHDQTICRAGGYSDSVRPPLELTEAIKYKLLAAYGVPASQISDYELDHLVPESAGGSSSTYNLWPEPNDDAGHYPRSEYVANDKDELEHRAWEALCDHQAKLRRTQRAMATNWTQLAR
jgi:hypothetical protein